MPPQLWWAGRYLKASPSSQVCLHSPPLLKSFDNSCKKQLLKKEREGAYYTI